jgi:sulfur transfer complex TusBCD TusB component (DsrH family)
MNKTQLAELRTLLTTLTRANAVDLFDRILELSDDALVRGVDRQNELLDRLVSRAATESFDGVERVEDGWYVCVQRERIWRGSLEIRGCNAWVLYDDVSGRGIVSFARPDVPLPDWFFPLERESLPGEGRALA